MLQYDFESSIGYWIWLTSHSYQQMLNAELEPYGITFRQFQVLAWLVHDGDLSQTQLAQRMFLEPPTLVGILDRMQRDGWIVRRSSSLDRRKKLISLQPQARPIWKKMVACLKRVRSSATRGMAGEDVDLLQGLLQQVLENLGAKNTRREVV